MYIYKLTDMGKKIGSQLVKRSKEYHEVKEVTEVCKEKASLDADILALASKVTYMVKQAKGPSTYQDLERTAKKLGWKIGKQEIDAGVRLSVALGFARTK